MIHAAANLVRGKGGLMVTFRILGFTQITALLQLLRLIPGLDSVMAFVVNLLTLFVLWLGLSEAHQVRGWRTVLMPLVYLALLVAGVVIFISLINGLSVALDTILSSFGLRP